MPQADIVLGGETVGRLAVSAGSRHEAEALAAHLQTVVQSRLRAENEIRSLSEELLSRYEELNLLYDLGQTLGAKFEPTEIARIAAERAARATQADCAVVLVRDADNAQGLTALGSWGFEAPTSMPSLGVSERAMAASRPVIVHADDVGVDGDQAERGIMGASVLSAPISVATGGDSDEVWGAVTVGRKRGVAMFSAGDAMLATAVASATASALFKCRAMDDLRSAERTRGELRVASRIQQSLLPDAPPMIPGAEVAGLCVPADDVGGDYYDFVLDARDRLGLVVADVSGHNVASALMMAIGRAALRGRLAAGLPPDEVLRGANMALKEDLERAQQFITAVVARYDPLSGRLLFGNAGNHPPLHVRAANRVVRRINKPGIVLGVLDDTEYAVATVALAPGDAVLLYTDGAVEARDGAGDRFGERRLAEIFSTLAGLPPATVVQGIYNAVATFCGGGLQDDIAMIVLKRNRGGDA
jgi:serine phosphatase RsbU (regulator of sigma subunit)